jgi:hypothetical protein
MRKRPLLALSAGLLIAAVPGAPAGAATRTLEVTSVTVSSVRHDVAPKGYSKGDTVVTRDRLLNATAQFGKKRGAVVGEDSSTLTFTGPHTATISGKATLPGGTLILGGEVIGLTNGGLAVQVIGGTGTYASVRGTLTVAAGKSPLNTYLLVLPSSLSA